MYSYFSSSPLVFLFLSLLFPFLSPIRFKTNFRNTILDVFKANGWKESESEVEWDIFWTNKEWIRGIYDKIHLEAHQRVNHFRNFYELTRKDLLVKNLKRARRTLQRKGKEEEASGAASSATSTSASGSSSSTTSSSSAASSSLDPTYDFFPDTYCLPAEYSLFVEAFKRAPPNSSWIMKPIGSSQGKGIFLFERLNQISEWKNDLKWKPEDSKAEKYIVQRYISNPLLIGGKKFDLRIYCLLASTPVRLASGASILAGDVRVGMKLAGEFGSVNVVAAPSDRRSLPTSMDMIRLRHKDGTSFVVKTGHLCTVRMKRGSHCVRGRDDSTITVRAFDSTVMQWREWGTRQYQIVKSDNSDGRTPVSADYFKNDSLLLHSNGIASKYPPLLCSNYDEACALLLADFDRSGLVDPASLPGRTLEFGDLIDISVDELLARPFLYEEMVTGLRMPAAMPIAPTSLPGVPFTVQPSFIACQRDLLHSSPRHHCLYVSRHPVTNEIEYRPVVPGDIVRVVFVMENDVITQDNTKSSCLTNLEQIMLERNILPIDGRESGVVITYLDSTTAECGGMMASSFSMDDDFVMAHLTFILHQLGALEIIGFGRMNQYWWSNFIHRIDGVTHVVEDETSIRFQYAPCSPSIGGSTVTLYKAASLTLTQHLRSISAVIGTCYGIGETPLEIESVLPAEFTEPQEYAPIEVDGNHRFQLADGVLTHNVGANN